MAKAKKTKTFPASCFTQMQGSNPAWLPVYACTHVRQNFPKHAFIGRPPLLRSSTGSGQVPSCEGFLADLSQSRGFSHPGQVFGRHDMRTPYTCLPQCPPAPSQLLATIQQWLPGHALHEKVETAMRSSGCHQPACDLGHIRSLAQSSPWGLIWQLSWLLRLTKPVLVIYSQRSYRVCRPPAILALRGGESTLDLWHLP